MAEPNITPVESTHTFGPWSPYGARQEVRRCTRCGYYQYRTIRNAPF